MSHNYPYRRSSVEFGSHEEAFPTSDRAHQEEHDVYRCSLQPSPRPMSVFTSSKSAPESHSSQPSTSGESALSLLSSCGLEPADLFILASMPENMITEETLPRLLMEIRQKKALRDGDGPPSPRRGTCHQPLQHSSDTWENSARSYPAEYLANPPIPPSPPPHSSYLPSRMETEDWKDPGKLWGNSGRTGAVGQEKTSSPYVVDYNYYGQPQEGDSQNLERPAYSARSVSIEERPHSPSPSDYRQLNSHEEPAALYQKKQNIPSATTVHSTPTAREARDLHSDSPQTFPYGSSLCGIAALNQKDWTLHVRGAQHADSQLEMLQMYLDRDCLTESARRTDSHSEEGGQEEDTGGGEHEVPQNCGDPGVEGKSSPAGDQPGGKVVCVKYAADTMDEDSLRRLVGHVGTAVNVLMFPVQAFIEMSAPDEADLVVKYFNRNPVVVEGCEVKFSMSATYNFLQVQNSPVVTFSSLPPGNEKYPVILGFARRFGTVKRSLYLPDQVLFEMGSREEAGKVVQHYIFHPFKIKDKIIHVSHSTEYSSLKEGCESKDLEDNRSVDADKDSEDGEASRCSDQTSSRTRSSSPRRSPSPKKKSCSPRRRSSHTRKRSCSPRRRSSRKRSCSPRRRSPRKRSCSPRRRSPYTRKRSCSPRRRSPKRSCSPRRRSPRKRSCSPRRRSPYTRKRSCSPRRRSPYTRKRSCSPRRRSPFTRKRSCSPRKRSPYTRRRSPRPRQQSPIERKRSPSPRRKSREKQNVASKEEDKASTQSSSRHGSQSSRRSTSITREGKSKSITHSAEKTADTQKAVVIDDGVLTETPDLGSSQEPWSTPGQTKESVPSVQEHPKNDVTSEETQEQTEEDIEGENDSDMDSDIEGMAGIGEDDDMRSEIGSMESLEETEEHCSDEAGTERPSAEDLSPSPSEVVELDGEPGSQSPTADSAMSEPRGIMAVQGEKKGGGQDEVEEPNEANDEVLFEMGSKEEAGKLFQHDISHPLKMKDKIIHVSHSTENCSLKSVDTDKDSEDGEASRCKGQSYRSRTRSSSPRRRSPSPKKRSCSPRRRSSYTRKRSRSPRRRSSYTKKRSRSPRRRSPYTRRRSPSRSPRRRSPYTRRRSPSRSPRRRSPYTRRRSPSLRQRSPIERKRSPSPRRKSKEKQNVASKVEDKASTQSSSRHGSQSSRRSTSITREGKSTSGLTKESVPSQQEHPKDDVTSEDTQEQTEEDIEGENDSDRDSDIEGMAGIGEDDDLRSEIGSMESLEETEEHCSDEAGTESPSAEDLSPSPSEVFELEEPGSQSPTADSAMSEPRGIMAVQGEKQGGGQDEVEEPNEAYDEVLFEMGSKEEAGKLVQHDISHPLKMKDKIIHVSHSTENCSLKSIDTDKDSEDGEASRCKGQSYRSRTRSSSPRRRSPSPKKRSCSPRRRSSYTRKRSCSPRRRSPYTRKRSRSPRRRSPYTRKRSRSPRRRSPYTRRRSPSRSSRRRSPYTRRRSPSRSPRRRSPYTRRRSPSLRQRSPIERKRSPSPRRKSKEKQNVVSKVEDKASTQSSSRHGSQSSRRSASIPRENKSTSGQTKESVPSQQEHPKDDVTSEDTQEQPEEDIEGENDSDMDSDIEGMAGIGEDDDLRSEIGSMESLEETEAHWPDEAGTERPSTEDLSPSPSEVVELEEPGSQSPTADSAIPEPRGITAVQGEKQGGGQDEVEEPNEAYDEVLFEMGSREEAGKLVQHDISHPLKMKDKIIHVSLSTENCSLKSVDTDKDSEDGEASRCSGQSYRSRTRSSPSPRRSPSPKKRSCSPRRRSSYTRKRSCSPRRRSSRKRSCSPRRRSPRKRSCSPRRRSSYTRKRSCSPSRRSPYTRKRSCSPRRRSPYTRKRSRSPRRRSPYTRRRSPSSSPRRRSPYTSRRSPSVRQRSPSPIKRKRSPSSRRKSKEKQNVVSKVEDKASTRSSSRHGSQSSRRSTSLTREGKSKSIRHSAEKTADTQKAVVIDDGVLTDTTELGSSQEPSSTPGQTKESVPSVQEHPKNDFTSEETQEQTEEDIEGENDSDMDSDIEGMAGIGEDDDMRSEIGSMESLEETEEHWSDEAGTERPSAEDLSPSPSEVVELDEEPGSTVDSAMSELRGIMAVQGEKQGGGQDEVEEPNEAYDEKTTVMECQGTTCTPAPRQCHRIWIIGDSYVQCGGERALETMGGNLGVDGVSVHWFGGDGLRWKTLLPFFTQCLRGGEVPDVLLIHCGGDDLGDVKSVDLVTAMKEDLQHLHLQHPAMRLIFSGITQRCGCKAGTKRGKINKARKFVNSVMAAYVQSLGGGFIDHPDIRFDTPGLFLRDGVQFTPLGNDIFLKSFVESIKAQLQKG